MLYDFGIIGGGFTGLFFAYMCEKKGYTYKIFEKEEAVGGLCKSIEVSNTNNWIDTGGGHFLYCKDKKIEDIIFSIADKQEFNRYTRKTQIEIDKKLYDYPLELNMNKFPIKDQIKTFIEFFSHKNSENNFERYAIQKFGSFVYYNYLKPYNEKLWGVIQEEMSKDWCYKIPNPSTKEIIKNYFINTKDKHYPSHPYFYYPKKGGFQYIIDSLYTKINTKEVEFLSKIKTINHYKSKNYLDSKDSFTNIIVTIPWKDLEHSDKTIELFSKKLITNSIVVSYERTDNITDNQWIYYPDKNLEEHRVFFTKNYGNSKNFLMKETNTKRFTKWEPKNWFINENSYPIPVIDSNFYISKILEHYKPYNIYGLGRYGQHQYFNIDDCAKEVLNFWRE